MNRDERLWESEKVYACIQRARLLCPHPWVWDYVTERSVAMAVVERHRPAVPAEIIDLSAWRERRRARDFGSVLSIREPSGRDTGGER